MARREQRGLEHGHVARIAFQREGQAHPLAARHFGAERAIPEPSGAKLAMQGRGRVWRLLQQRFCHAVRRAYAALIGSGRGAGRLGNHALLWPEARGSGWPNPFGKMARLYEERSPAQRFWPSLVSSSPVCRTLRFAMNAYFAMRVSTMAASKSPDVSLSCT